MMGTKKRNKGKEKGSKFERLMCKRLSKWWTDGSDDQVFWRNSGFLSRAGACVEHQYGDIHAISDRGKWFVKNVNVELKFYKDLRLLEVIDKPSKKHVLLIEHWCQCIDDADKSGREPMLIAKRNRGEPFVVCMSDLAGHLVEDGDRVDFFACGYYLSLFSLDNMEEFCPAQPDFVDALEGTRRDRERKAERASVSSSD